MSFSEGRGVSVKNISENKFLTFDKKNKKIAFPFPFFAYLVTLYMKLIKTKTNHIRLLLIDFICFFDYIFKNTLLKY